MSWSDFTIEPIDVWLFRDGRPFSAGSDVWARSLPMPSAFTLLGALRTFFLTQAGISPRDFYEGNVPWALKAQWGGPGADAGQLRLRGPFWYRNGQLYFPTPADLVRVQGKLQRLQPLPPPNLNLLHTNLPSNPSLLWAKSPHAVEFEGGYLSHGDFEKYLRLEAQSDDGLEGLEPLSLQAFLERERRTGIKIGQGRTVEEGFLYQVEFVCLKEGVQLYGSAWLPNGTQPTDGLLFLGGERRMGALRWNSSSAQSDPKAPTLDRLLENFRATAKAYERVKVILLSPAYFSAGWQPEDWSSMGLAGWKLVAAAVPRLIPMGIFEKKGGNIFQKRFYCVPPGSVYFFERGQSQSQFPDAFTEEPSASMSQVACQAEKKSKPSANEECSTLPLKKLGFGLYATSTWNYA